MENRDSLGRFTTEYAEPLSRHLNFRFTPQMHAAIRRKASEDGLTLSGLIRAAVDGDKGLADQFPGWDGRTRLYAALRPYWSGVQSEVTFFKSVRFTATQVAAIEDRARRMALTPFRYLDAAVAAYLGQLTKE